MMVRGGGPKRTSLEVCRETHPRKTRPMQALRHPILDDSGHDTGATFELDGTTIVYHSRGTTEGSRAYRAGLELLLTRLEKRGIGIRTVHVDTRTTKHLPASERRIFLGGEHYPTRAELMTAAAKVGRPPGAKGGGNGNKRIRIRLDAPREQMLRAIQVISRG